MKTEWEMHEHPKPGPFGGGYTHVGGFLLEPGDTIEPTDVYDSTSGYWVQAPCPGCVIQGGVATTWVRPGK